MAPGVSGRLRVRKADRDRGEFLVPSLLEKLACVAGICPRPFESLKYVTGPQKIAGNRSLLKPEV